MAACAVCSALIQNALALLEAFSRASVSSTHGQEKLQTLWLVGDLLCYLSHTLPNYILNIHPATKVPGKPVPSEIIQELSIFQSPFPFEHTRVDGNLNGSLPNKEALYGESPTSNLEKKIILTWISLYYSNMRITVILTQVINNSIQKNTKALMKLCQHCIPMIQYKYQQFLPSTCVKQSHRLVSLHPAAFTIQSSD